MKRYLLILTALLVLVGIVGLPPRHYTASWWLRDQHRTPERRLYLDLRDDIVRESWLYQRIQWRDSVSSVLQPLELAVDPYHLAVPESTPDTLRARLERGVRLQLEAMDALPPKVPVGVFLIPRNTGGHPSSLKNHYGYMWTQREFYVAREGESPFCALVESVAGAGSYEMARTLNRLVFIPQDNLSDPNALRICGFFARYGVPGTQVNEWLRDGAALFGSGFNMARRSLVYLQDRGPRGPFGLITRYSSISHTGLACLAGVDSACRDIFMRGGRVGTLMWWARDWKEPEEFLIDSPVDYLRSRWQSWGHLGYMDPYIFTSLEEEFGVDRFEAFWSSELPVEKAFQAAFGVPVDKWVMSWAQGLYGSVDRGPAVPLNATLLTFLTFGLFGSGALYMGRRRS